MPLHPSSPTATQADTPLARALQRLRVVAVVVIDHVADALPVHDALRRGGIGAVEVALRTPASLDALRTLRSADPDLLIGAGTVLDPAAADAAQAAGADFALAPGLDPATVRHCAERAFPFVPGVATPTDVQAACALGCRLLKFFPAETMGGLKGLETLASPFAHLGVRFLPLGGISAETAPTWLASPLVAAIGGSWIAPRALVAARDWEEIRRRAAIATSLISPAK